MKGAALVLFATCSFAEYDPAQMGGIPVRTSNGTPRYRLRYPLQYELPRTFPAWKLVKAADQLGWERFSASYTMRLDEIGVEHIRRDAENIRRDAVRVLAKAMPHITDESPLVLLCYEQMGAKPNNWCHRTAFRAWWQHNTGEEVPELGAPMLAEIKSQDPLF